MKMPNNKMRMIQQVKKHKQVARPKRNEIVTVVDNETGEELTGTLRHTQGMP